MGVMEKAKQFQESLGNLFAAIQVGSQEAVQAFDGTTGAWPLRQDGCNQVLQGRQAVAQMFTGLSQGSR